MGQVRTTELPCAKLKTDFNLSCYFDCFQAEFPTIQSTHSLVAKYVTPEVWEKLSGIKTKTSGFTLAKAIACAVEFDDQVSLPFKTFVNDVTRREGYISYLPLSLQATKTTPTHPG